MFSEKGLPVALTNDADLVNAVAIDVLGSDTEDSAVFITSLTKLLANKTLSKVQRKIGFVTR